MKKFERIFNSHKAFVGYITAGHRGMHYTEQAACALVKGGVDILEIGVPFSDPIADGAIIQEAMVDALNNSSDLKTVFRAVSNIKQKAQVPIILFTYLNPLLAIGIDSALYEASKAGVDGILVVDLPIEESSNYFEKCIASGLEPICLVSPSTDNNRVVEINRHCNSFLYYVCRNGTTGIKNSLPNDYIQKIKSIKLHSDKPVVSGFGIGDKALAKQVLQHADGFVVGSAFVKAISDGASPADLQNLATEIDPR